MKTLRLFASTLLMTFFSHVAKADTSLKIFGFDFAPFTIDKSGSLEGVAVDLTNTMAKDLGFSIAGSATGSVKRVLEKAAEPNILIPMLTRTPDREDKVFWIGKLADDTNCFFTKKSLHVENLDDAKKLKSVGVNAGGATEKFLTENGFKNIEPIANNSLNFRKIEAGRLEAWYTSELVSKFTVLKEKGDRSLYSCTGNIKKAQYWVAMSLQTPKDTVDKFKAKFSEMEKAGTISKAISDYMK